MRRTVRREMRRREEGKEESESQITMHEMERAINNSAPNKSAGEDNIPYELIQHLGPKAKELLLTLYNKCWKGKGIPRKWRTAIIKPLLKDDKDPKCKTSYRPISLMSCLGKILERIIAERLIYVLETRIQLT